MVEASIDWQQVLGEPEFWRSYLAQEESNLAVVELWMSQLGLYSGPGPEEEDLDTDGLPEALGFGISLDGSHGLIWSFYSRYGASGHTLLLDDGTSDWVKLGWSDGHFHLDLLRWEEREAMIAAAHAVWTGPFDAVFLPPLLSVYLGAVPEYRSRDRVRRLREEWAQIALFSRAEVNRVVDRLLECRPDARWDFDPSHGWLYAGPHSTRSLLHGDTAVRSVVRELFSSLGVPEPE